MSETVQRYNRGPFNMYSAEDGEYILYSDYAKLETELRDTKRALELAVKDLHYRTAFDPSREGTAQEFIEEARKERLSHE